MPQPRVKKRSTEVLQALTALIKSDLKFLFQDALDEDRISKIEEVALPPTKEEARAVLMFLSQNLLKKIYVYIDKEKKMIVPVAINGRIEGDGASLGPDNFSVFFLFSEQGKINLGTALLGSISLIFKKTQKETQVSATRQITI